MNRSVSVKVEVKAERCSSKLTLAICRVLGSDPRFTRISTNSSTRTFPADAPHAVPSSLTGDPNPILIIRDDAFLLEDLVQLRSRSVEDDGVESEPVEKGEGEGEVV